MALVLVVALVLKVIVLPLTVSVLAAVKEVVRPSIVVEPPESSVARDATVAVFASATTEPGVELALVNAAGVPSRLSAVAPAMAVVEIEDFVV